MAKGRKKASGRGRRGAAYDPATGRFLKTKTTSATTTTTTVTAAAPTPAAVPTGPTVTPEQIKEEISGFRKALMQTMKDLEGSESEIQDAVLDGLRKTAEELVTQNEDIFGKRSEKTVEQSAAYEIFDAVVGLSEQAAKARTVEQKRKILQRLRTFKKVAQSVFKGGGKQGEIANKLMEMIAKIEEPLMRETGMRAAAKEKIGDYLKELPEKMAAKIPLVGGMISRSLQRRREGKEEEAAALSTLTEEISRAGKTSLYGKGGGGSIGPTPSGMDAMEPPILGASTGTTEPPIPGGSTVAEMAGGGRGFNRQVVTTLGAILANVIDIKKLMIDRYDPASEELKNEEARREAENSKKGMLARLKGLMSSSGKGKGESKAASLMEALGIDKLMGDIGKSAIGGAIGGMVGPALGALAAGLGTFVFSTLPYWLGYLVGTITTAITALISAIVPAIVASVGAALGLGIAWLVNKSVDKIFGTDLGERMFDENTWAPLWKTPDDVLKDRAFAQSEADESLKMQKATGSMEYIERASQDPRRLPDLVKGKYMSGKKALAALSAYEQQYGAGADTEEIRKRIIQLDPRTTGSISPNAVVVPSINNQSNSMINNLNQANENLRMTELVGPPAPGGGNTVIAPNTTNNNTTINNNSGNSGVRNNDPTLKAAERATMP